jgi:hypothetical protein
MSDKQKKDPDRPKRIVLLAEELAKRCEVLQSSHAIKAQEYGYSREIFMNIADTIDQVTDYPELSATEISLNEFRKFVLKKEASFENIDFDLSSGSYALGTATIASTSFSSSSEVTEWFQNLEYPTPPPSWQPDRQELYAYKLENIDSELAKLYRSVWQLFYGGTENAERAALLSMRQLYDHFFEKIAPDEQVRSSPYFTLKEGENPNQIYRKERIRYAANEKVKNEEISRILETQADSIVEIYNGLNKLHKRGALKSEEVRRILIAMQTIIEQWLD